MAHKPNPFYQTGNVDTSVAGRVDTEAVRVLPEEEPGAALVAEETHLAAPEGSPEAAEGRKGMTEPGNLTVEDLPEDQPEAAEVSDPTEGNDQTEGTDGEEVPPPPDEEPEENPDAGDPPQDVDVPMSEGFQVSEHSVAEVLEHLGSHPEERDAILAAEKHGKNRKGILALEEQSE